MKLSVCIPSYNPTVTLTTTVDSLISQKQLIDELVIVIDNKDYTKQVDELQKKYVGVFKLLITMQQLNTGRAGARNKCAEIANGDIILFLDDDMIAEDNLIQKHLEYHTQKGECILSGSGYSNPSEAKTSFRKFIVNTEISWQKDIPINNIITYDKFTLTACNMSMPASLFKKLKGFDAQLKDGEDFDFGVRALDNGIRVFYDAKIIAWHNDNADLKKIIRRLNEYNRGRVDILKLHPEYLKKFPHFLPKAPGFVKKTMKAICRYTIAPFVLADSFVFRVLPLKIKFILYRVTIAAHVNRDSK
jgi:GT2 family glycosyltransferase